jgi:cytochrome c553
MRLACLLAALTSAMAQGNLFESKVRPVFAGKCQICHGGKAPMAGVDLTTGKGVSGERLLTAISYESRIKMPPNGKLKEGEIAAVAAWVKQGAEWPASEAAASRKPDGSWWSFQPVKPRGVPAGDGGGWARNEIDRFLAAKLSTAGLEPARPADRLTLLRRVTFDLTGLPPTESEIAAFLDDSSPVAFARVVDRLLDSPRYGEHWGRHWLDVARYADSTGADEDHRYPHAWRYRDYVVNAFNRDIPYDRFVREQIAGDTLAAEDGGEVNADGIVATGFLALGPKLIAEQDKKKMFYDIVDEQIEVTGKAMLGLTIACARCHDHKFDPITTKDYYSLASIFASSKQLSKLEGTVSQLYFAPLVPKETAGRWQKHKDDLDAKQKQIDGVIAVEQSRYRDRHAPRLAAYMMAAREVYEGGAKAEAISAKGDLDPWVVEQWARYLAPTGERRIYLERWLFARAAEREAVSREYQQNYESEKALRAEADQNWRKAVEASKNRGEKEPERPRFLAGDNRFFTEVVAPGGPFKMPEKDRESLYQSESREKLARYRAELEALRKSAPPEPPLACALGEDKPVDQRVFVGGNPEALGDPVEKRFPVVLAGGSGKPIREGSGRRELAEWIAGPSNPLTARVMVNRIWQWHFGEGLVRTVNNFGKLGDQPAHPDLLDWLAAKFIESGWSVKKMNRLILDSSAYRMSSLASSEAREKDSENRLLSRFPRRRLAVEEMRDAMLSIDGTLDLTMGGTLQSGTGTDKEFAEDRKSLNPDHSPRRLIYLPLRRSNLASVLNLFDFGDATTSSEGRTQTNIAPQTLYMMNGEFVALRARNVADRLLRDAALDDEARIRRAHLIVLSRPADPGFVTAATQYLEKFPGTDRSRAWASFCRALISSNDFLYVH